MRNRKHLQTDFIKFILEKYSQGQDLPVDEIESPDEETTEPHQRKKNNAKRLVEFEEEPNEDDEKSDDEIIDELLNEYKRLKRKNESNRLLNRGKR